METHFLTDFVKDIERAKEPEPWYNEAGDCFVYQMADEATVAERIDDVLTIYHSAITGSPIGFQIKDIRAIIKRFGWDGIVIESTENKNELKTISISALLLAAYQRGPKTIGRRKAYAELLDSPFARPARMLQSDFAALSK